MCAPLVAATRTQSPRPSSGSLSALDRCVMTRVHRHGIGQSSVAALKAVCLPYPQLQATTDLLLTLEFCLFWNVTALESYPLSPFQIGFFHLVLCI